MKKYDKIYVPHDPKVHGITMDDNYHVSHEGFAGPTGSPVEVVRQRDVIIVTMGELQGIWDAGWRAKTLENNSKAINVDFKSYMQSKGITL